MDALVKMLEDSLRWSRDHKGKEARHTIPCEWCFQEGLCHAIAALLNDGTTAGEVRARYTVKPKRKMTRRKSR